MLKRWRRGAGDDGAAPESAPGPDLGTVPPRLRPQVEQAVAARHRWAAVLGSVAPGPLHDRLSVVGGRIDGGVAEMVAVAQRIGEIDRVVAALEPDRATDAYKQARRAAASGAAPPELAALEARFASVQRLMNLALDSEQRLGALEARLEAAIAQAAELAVTQGDQVRADLVGGDLAAVTDELTALRTAMAAVDQA